MLEACHPYEESSKPLGKPDWEGLTQLPSHKDSHKAAP